MSLDEWESEIEVCIEDWYNIYYEMLDKDKGPGLIQPTLTNEPKIKRRK